MFEELLMKVETITQPLLAHLGFRLIECLYLSEHGRWVLRLYIDKEGGNVTIGDCQQVSRTVGAAIDVENFMPGAYVLEVSSPGINRSQH